MNDAAAQQHGLNILKASETFRKVLISNIHPTVGTEEKVKVIADIRKMDYNELRAAVLALTK